MTYQAGGRSELKSYMIQNASSVSSKVYKNIQHQEKGNNQKWYKHTSAETT